MTFIHDIGFFLSFAMFKVFSSLFTFWLNTELPSNSGLGSIKKDQLRMAPEPSSTGSKQSQLRSAPAQTAAPAPTGPGSDRPWLQPAPAPTAPAPNLPHLHSAPAPQHSLQHMPPSIIYSLLFVKPVLAIRIFHSTG